MEEIRIDDDGRYRGRDLLNIQKKLIFETLTKEIREQNGKFAYFLDKKNEYAQEYDTYNKQLIGEVHAKWDQKMIERLEEKTVIILENTENILKILQPLYSDLFDQIADKIPPGLSYNEELKQDVRFDLILGEKEISGNVDGSTDTYWMESVYKDKKEREIKKWEEKKQEKVRLAAGHRLITDQNYPTMTQELIPTMENIITEYGQKFGIDLQNPVKHKEFVQTYFLYILINSLITKKMVFDTKSTKSKICLDETISMILDHFKTVCDTDIDYLIIKKKLRHNTKNLDSPLDLAYEYSELDDLELWEEYLNDTYFSPQWIGIEQIRRDIMEEYNSQKWLKEKLFEFLNPLYHIYKDKEEKYQKHLNIIKEYQKKTKSIDPHIEAIIHEIEEWCALMHTKKVEHTRLEEKFAHIKPIYDHTLTEIQNKTLKRYKVPIQYRHIFGIVLNKINNFYQIKINLSKKADKKNQESMDRLLHSPKTLTEISYYLQEYRTQKDIDTAFEKKRYQKREERKFHIKYIATNYKKFVLDIITKKHKQEQKKKENTLPKALFSTSKPKRLRKPKNNQKNTENT